MTTHQMFNMMIPPTTTTDLALDVSTRDGFASMMQMYQADAAENLDDDELADVDINRLIPSIRLGRENPTMSVTIGEEPIKPQNGSKSLQIVIVKALAQRALWAHDGIKDHFQRPVCSTGWVRPIDLKRGNVQGSFTLNEYVAAPHDLEGEHIAGENVCFNCEECCYNKFGSMAAYDPKRGDSRAKACGESRDFIVILVERGSRLPIEDEDLYEFTLSPRFRTVYNPFGVCLLRVTYGSNSKEVAKMGQQAAVREVSISALIFKIGNELIEGQFKIPTLKSELSGMITPDDFRLIKTEVSRWCNEFVARNAHSDKVVPTEPAF